MIVGAVLVTAGAAFSLLAAVGLLRLPDVFARLHAATKASSLGIALVLVGVVVIMPTWSVAVKVLIAIVFQFATAPVSAHVIGRAAHRSGIHGELAIDDLAGRDEQQ